MATRSLAPEEKYALPVAAALHVALVFALLWKPVGEAIVEPPERIAVSIADEVGLVSTSPDPVADAAPPTGAEIVEDTPAKTVPERVVEPQPRREPVVRPDSRRPPQRRDARRETRQPAAKAAQPKGEIGRDFLGGKGTSETSQNTGAPAAEIGPAIRNSLSRAISQQLSDHWNVPQGADAEKLVTILAWDLNPDGSLRGNPRVVRQLGITDANRAQADRHAEQAIRAVRLAAPFRLPEEYYDAWKRVSDFRFDRRL